MAQLTDDCFANGGALVRLDTALADILSRLAPVVDPERIPLADATGRFLAEDVMAPISVPQHDNSAVDGYAVRFDDLATSGQSVLAVAGRAAAGHPFAGSLPAGAAIRIFTGAPMPDGADTVMMQEDCRREGDRVVLLPGIRRGANRRLAGEDVKAGTKVLGRGRRLRVQDVGLLAALGLTETPVFRPLRVAVLSTGDEVCEPGRSLPAGAIYDSNRAMLRAMLTRQGCAVTDLGIVPDRSDKLARCLAEAAAGHDAIISSGGVSTGEEDHVRAVMERLGSLHFWRLAIKPGRPVAMGQIGRVPYIGLPGNPVATFVTFLRFARPVLGALGGGAPEQPLSFEVRADFSYRKKADRREWVRVSLGTAEDGATVARKYMPDGAGILMSTVTTDGLAELGEETTSVVPGDMVRVFPYSAFGI